jgi:hypothetical protein
MAQMLERPEDPDRAARILVLLICGILVLCGGVGICWGMFLCGRACGRRAVYGTWSGLPPTSVTPRLKSRQGGAGFQEKKMSADSTDGNTVISESAEDAKTAEWRRRIEAMEKRLVELEEKRCKLEEKTDEDLQAAYEAALERQVRLKEKLVKVTAQDTPGINAAFAKYQALQSEFEEMVFPPPESPNYEAERQAYKDKAHAFDVARRDWNNSGNRLADAQHRYTEAAAIAGAARNVYAASMRARGPAHLTWMNI